MGQGSRVMGRHGAGLGVQRASQEQGPSEGPLDPEEEGKRWRRQELRRCKSGRGTFSEIRLLRSQGTTLTRAA